MRNFSTHTPTRGETKEEYYMLTVGNARLKWAEDPKNQQTVLEKFDCRYECVKDPVPARYKFAGGMPKPTVIQM